MREVASPHPDGSAVVLQEGERIDDLLDDSLRIIQHRDALKFSLDAVLLAKFAPLRKGDRVADLGTGGGVIPLILAAKRGASHVTGIEIQEFVADMAQRSVRLNNLDGHITIVRADLRDLPETMNQQFDLVVSNPPYMRPGEGKPTAKQAVSIAKLEMTCCLDDVLRAAGRLLRPKGRAAFVYRPIRLPELLSAMQKAHIEPKRLRMVHPFDGSEANLVLVEGQHFGRPGLVVLPPLTVHRAIGEYTDEMCAIYGRQSGRG